MEGREEQVRAELKQLGHEQMDSVERFATGAPRHAIAAQVAADEHVDRVFGCTIDGKTGMVALSERRLLASYGRLGRFESIDYQSITQVSTGLTSVEISGPGVSVELNAIDRDEFVEALDEHRRAAAAATEAPRTSTPTDDPMALIEHLGRLKEQGLLTDEEFAAKKAELLARM
jgi:hypothetical protein